MPRPRHHLQALALAAVALAALPTRAAPAITPPAPARFVTDQVQFLSPAAAGDLDRRLSDYQRATGHQVLLWIGHTTNGEPIETWAARAFAAWRVGRQGIDDGVALFVMADDRKLRIEVGYGLEDRLPDVRAARIIREQITPRLQAGDRDGAARAGVEAILAALGGAGAPAAGAPQEEQPEAQTGQPHLGLGELILLGVLGLLVLGFLVTHPGLALLLLTNLGSGGRRPGDGSGWGGGGFGGGGGFSGGGGRSGGGGASGSW